MSTTVSITIGPINARTVAASQQYLSATLTPGPPAGSISRRRHASPLSLRSIMGSDATKLDGVGGHALYVGPSPEIACPVLFPTGLTRGFPRFEASSGSYVEGRRMLRLRDCLHYAVVLVQENDLDDSTGQYFDVYYVSSGRLYATAELAKYRLGELTSTATYEVTT